MQKYKKISICVVSAFVVCNALYFGTLAILPNVIDLNKYKASVIETIEKETSFKVSCEDISLNKTFSPYLNIHMYHTAVLYPNDEIFIKLKEADLKVKLLPLVFKKIVIKDAKLYRPIINITLYNDFSTSLEKYIKQEKITNTKGFKLASLKYDTICENYKIKFKDESLNKNFYLEGEELVLKDFNPNEKARVILKGFLFENKKEYIKYDIDVLTYLNAEKRNFTFSPFKPIIDSSLKSNILGHLRIDKENNINGELKISDLSLNISNNVISGNNANLIFKGKEALIDIILHTSKKDSAELKGKFGFGKKKYIDVNTKAKNVNLGNLAKIISDTTELLNIDNPIQNVKITGLLNADFNVYSDMKKLKSSGKVNIKNGTIQHEELPSAINAINAEINLDNNRVNIENASATINKQPLKIKGYIDENVNFDIDAFSENIKLRNIITLFDLEQKLPISSLNGILSLNSNIKGKLNKNYKINSEILLSDFKCVNKKYHIPIDSKLLKIKFEGNDKKYSGNVEGENFYTVVNKQKIKAKNINFTFNEKEVIIPENIIETPDKLKISGNIKDYKINPSFLFNFNGNITAIALADMVKSVVDMQNKAVGVIPIVGKISMNDNKVNVSAQLKANESNYVSYLVIKELLKKKSILKVSASIADDIVNIEELSLEDDSESSTVSANKNSSFYKNKILTASGQIIGNKEKSFKNFRIIVPNTLTAATNFMGGEEISLNCDVLLNNSINAPVITGNAKVFRYDVKRYLSKVRNADISFAKDNIRITAPDVNVYNSFINVVADIVPIFNQNKIKVSNLQVNSTNIDLNSWFELAEKNKNPLKEIIFDIDKGYVAVNHIKVLDIKAKDMTSDIELKNDVIKLKNLNASAYSGKVKGKIEYSPIAGFVDISITGNGLDIKNSLYDLCKVEDNLAGITNFDANISLSTGATYNYVVKSINGNVKFDSYNGKMGSLGKFEYYLYAQNLLYHGLLNTTLNRLADAVVRNNTSQFHSAEGKLLFQNGYLLTEGIHTVGNNMSLYIKGRHNLISNQSNFDIYGRISDEVKNKLGSFGNKSISEMINSTEEKKKNNVVKIPESIISEIPNLYNNSAGQTNTFKVSIYGNLNSRNSISAIKSFEWILPSNYKIKTETNEEEIEENTKLPDFSDMLHNL